MCRNVASSQLVTCSVTRLAVSAGYKMSRQPILGKFGFTKISTTESLRFAT